MAAHCELGGPGARAGPRMKKREGRALASGRVRARRRALSRLQPPLCCSQHTLSLTPFLSLPGRHSPRVLGLLHRPAPRRPPARADDLQDRAPDRLCRDCHPHVGGPPGTLCRRLPLPGVRGDRPGRRPALQADGAPGVPRAGVWEPEGEKEKGRRWERGGGGHGTGGGGGGGGNRGDPKKEGARPLSLSPPSLSQPAHHSSPTLLH